MVPTLPAALLFLLASAPSIPALLGCKADAGKQDTGLSARTSLQVPATQVSFATSRPAGTATAGEPVIVCFGDSLTAGYGIDPGDTYPDVLQHRLDAAGYHYRVVNAGVSGETTKDGLDRISHVLARKPSLVVVEFGGNDGLRGLPVAESQRNLTAIVQTLQAGGAKVAMAGITLPPQFGGDYIRQFNAMFPAVAGQYHVPLLPFLLQDVYGVQGDIQDDGIHPTAQGARQVAVNVEKLITPMLQK